MGKMESKKSNGKPRIFHEALNPHFGYYYTIDKSLYAGQTRFQKIEVIETPELGRVLLLDGITQVAEKNEFQYHEPMVHPAVIAHPDPRRVLVVGGGDGCILRELLKYAAIEQIDFVELDEGVIDCAKKYFAHQNQNAFDDERVAIHITDGRQFVEKAQKSYDIVIMDMTDPFGPSKFLYTREFFQHIQNALRDKNGIFVMHSESPISRPAAYACILKTLSAVFNQVVPLFIYIQMYAVLWSISLAGNSELPATIAADAVDAKLVDHGLSNLKVFNGQTFEAMRVAYPYIDEIRLSQGRVITDAAPDFPDDFLMKG
jgi:spermidine synthase